MTYEDFFFEASNLIQRFDKKYYPPQVMDLIYNEVKDLSREWLSKTVTYLSAQRYAPLLPEFKEASRIEKDRIRYAPAKQPSSFKEQPSMFNDEQRAFLFRLTKAVSARQIPHQNEFVKLFTPVLQRVIDCNDKIAAHNLFEEISKRYSIPYDHYVAQGSGLPEDAA